MIKTFIFGIVVGVAAAIAGVYFLPVVDQVRESSVITVSPNGGSSEAFHINVPSDRIVVASAATNRPVPDGLDWPDELSSVSADMYKLRNVHDTVIGVASRTAVSDDVTGDTIEWVLHMPARGSLYVTMQTTVENGSDRFGKLLRGSREFSGIRGVLRERWVEGDGSDESRRGRIELVSRFQGEAEQ